MQAKSRKRKQIVACLIPTLAVHAAALMWISGFSFSQLEPSSSLFQKPDVPEVAPTALVNELDSSDELARILNSAEKAPSSQDFAPVTTLQVAANAQTLPQSGSEQILPVPLESVNFLAQAELAPSVFEPLLASTQLTMPSDSPLQDPGVDAALASLNTSPQLSHATGLAADGVVASSSDFRVSVEKEDLGNGQIAFRLSFVPDSNVHFKRIRQNIFFLIDQSFSITKGRLEQAKAAVSEALSLLNPDDTFNVLAFDSKIRKWSPISRAVTPENIAACRSFLSDLQQAALFTGTDLYGSLGRIVPQEVKANEINVAIMLTDGDSRVEGNQHGEAISAWIAANSGRISLFTMTASPDDYTGALALLSYLSRGSNLACQESGQMKDTLRSFMQATQTPIGKNMAVTAVTKNKQGRVRLFPAGKAAPDLYAQKPYVIYGIAENVKDFAFFLQGKYYDQPFDVTRQIRLDEAASADLHKQIEALQLAERPADFLREGARL